MPTLRASTPASMRFFAWAAVTTRGRQTHKKISVGVGRLSVMARHEQAVTVPTNHLEFRVFLLDVVYSVDLIHGVPLGGVLQKKKQTINSLVVLDV